MKVNTHKRIANTLMVEWCLHLSITHMPRDRSWVFYFKLTLLPVTHLSQNNNNNTNSGDDDGDSFGNLMIKYMSFGKDLVAFRCLAYSTGVFPYFRKDRNNPSR